MYNGAQNHQIPDRRQVRSSRTERLAPKPRRKVAQTVHSLYVCNFHLLVYFDAIFPPGDRLRPSMALPGVDESVQATGAAGLAYMPHASLGEVAAGRRRCVANAFPFMTSMAVL